MPLHWKDWIWISLVYLGSPFLLLLGIMASLLSLSRKPFLELLEIYAGLSKAIFWRPLVHGTCFNRAERKARKLLRANLPRKCFGIGTITVRGGVTGKEYKIGDGSVLLKGIASLCVGFPEHNKEDYPPSDYMLAMALHIQHNEMDFLSLANVSYAIDRRAASRFYGGLGIWKPIRSRWD